MLAPMLQEASAMGAMFRETRPDQSTLRLGECLQGRTVLEFPTIYVFPASLQQLPQGFMLEEDYLKQEGEEMKEFKELMSELDPEILARLKEEGRQTGTPRKEEEVDSKEILHVLKKDFGALV
ncbi:Box C/D snoRNA accumulation [Pleosporales sp. CAS-2024a]